MSQQCALAAKKIHGILCCIRQSTASMSRGDSVLMRAYMDCCVQFWASKGDMDVLDRVQLRAIMMTKSLENLCYEER